MAIKTQLSIQQIKTLLKTNGFTLYYQPILSIDTGKIIGAEALARAVINDEVYAPCHFLNSIKSSISMLENFERSLFLKFLQGCHILAGYGFQESINYNLSAKHINKPGCALYLITQYMKYSKMFKPILEITEQECIDNSFTARENIDSLSNIFTLYIDDFGTGYANLHYILNYGFKGMKVDKSFIDKLTDDERSLILLKGLIPTVKNLGITTVAEGIETEEQFEIIKSLQFDKGQGFYWSEPLPINEFILLNQLLNMSPENLQQEYNKLTLQNPSTLQSLLEKSKILVRYLNKERELGEINV